MNKHLIALIFGGFFSLSSFATPEIDSVKFRASIELGNVSRAEEWLKSGLDPNYQGDLIGTGIMIGAWNNDVKMMETFLRYGGDINITNRFGEQALLHAAWKGSQEALEWLVRHGAKVNRDEKKWTALHYAAFSGNERAFDFLVSNGADINALSPNGSSVLMMAVYENKEAIVNKLLKFGADKLTKNDWGDGAAEWAVKFNHLNLAKKVAPNEADYLALMDKKMKSPEPWKVSMKSSKAPYDIEKLLYKEREILANGGDPHEIKKEILNIQIVYLQKSIESAKEEMESQTVVITARKKGVKR